VLEPLYEFHSLYSHSAGWPTYPGKHFDMKHCSGGEYLASLERSPS
jgi:hypothetical protein